jgi:predicted NUDIX family NTP pyrophosphohydrolase
MAKKTAGILMYRIRNRVPEFLLAHPGGPLWAKKDLEAWTLPKGEFENEDPLTAARREFKEEMGSDIDGQFIPLKPAKSSSKILYPFAVEGEFDVSTVKSNFFEMEWPPKSGRMGKFPEVDRAEWFAFPIAITKINKYQAPVLHEVKDMLERIKC